MLFVTFKYWLIGDIEYHNADIWQRNNERILLTAFGTDLADESGDGDGVGYGDDDDLAAITVHHLPAADLGGGIVAALGEDVGFQGRQDLGKLFRRKHGNVVHCLQSGQHPQALVCMDHRPARTFDPTDGVVGVQGDDQNISQAPGFLQKFNVPPMQEIEATVGEDQPLALGLEAGGQQPQFRQS